MEFKIAKNHLLRGLYLASGIADRKSTMPILANVLIRTDGKDHVLCAATDLGVAVMTRLPAKVDKEGALTLSARQFYEIAKGLSGEEVYLRRTEQNWAEIKAGSAEFKIVGMADREYPKLPSVAEALLGKVDSKTFGDMIGKTIFSVSTDETRQHLAGVFFESDGSKAGMVSTDGHRLSKISHDLAGALKLDVGVLLPRKGIIEVRRALEGRETPCEIGVYQGHFVLRADDVTMTIKLSDGQFPPYDQVIPKDNDKVIVVNRVELLDALRRVAIVASDKTWGVRFSLEKGRLSIEADNPDLGTARERLEVGFTGASVNVGFNAKYFIELLGEMASTDVKIELAGELDPAVVKPVDGGDYLCVVMPMRL